MARPREFDIDEVLDAALDVFWAHGYEATSVTDLMQATGLQKGSLYKAFGDKHSLFVATLDRYMERMCAQSREMLQQQPAPEAVRTCIRAVIEFPKQSDDKQERKGCMACNSVVELAPHDPEVKKVMQRHYMRMENMLASVLEQGQKSRDFRGDVPASRLARFLMVFAAGSAATAKGSFAGLDQEDLSEVVFAALQ